MSEYAVALGMFDSVHIGHKAVIDNILKDNRTSAVLTFDSLPTKSGGVILKVSEKQQKLISLGVDEVYVLKFEEIKNLSPKDFLDMLLNSMNIKKIVCGYNFRFGKNAEGDVSFISQYCLEKCIEFVVTPEVKCGDETVSTSRIKELLANGDVKHAALLLGEPYSFCETVVEGDKRGRTLGFPTINQNYPKEKAVLRFGVYETKAEIDGKTYKAVTNFGLRPTFEKPFPTAETYIIDFDGNCYGKTVKISFISYLRDERKFGNIEELKKEIENNINSVKKSLC